ncbi:glycosyltransferase family 4 protein [Salmonirosea aquatica]|uniref:Glycosyltransferase n=1 Tax=Salmonirosea aquatica TaxID=2654236 RepID=A0A7C9BJL1_9BACT|nr:glycosyltransferase [Cytophagaceae bacterium SJW1-29]
MHSKRVLFISHDANRAGSQLLLLQLIKLLKAQGISSHLLLCDGGDLVEDFKAVTSCTLLESPPSSPLLSKIKKGVEKIPFLRLPSAGTNAKVHLRLETELSQLNIGLVFVNSVANAAFYQQNLVFLHALPVVLFAHELEMSVATYTAPESLRFLLQKCDHLIAVSKAVADFYIRDYGYPTSRVSTFTLINSGEILNNLASLDPHYTHPALPTEADAIIIGGCGNAEWRKGNDIFNLIARQVIETMPTRPIYFVWVGAGPMHAFYEQIKFDIERFGLSRQIILIPPTPEALNIMNRFDLFLLSSREDPYPLVVLEAALLQKPIICFEKAGGAPELVEQDAGEVVGYLDVAAASQAIITLINDPVLRKKKGKAAHHKVLERHNTEQSIQKILTIIHDLMPVPVSENVPLA